MNIDGLPGIVDLEVKPKIGRIHGPRNRWYMVHAWAPLGGKLSFFSNECLDDDDDDDDDDVDDGGGGGGDHNHSEPLNKQPNH
jgi:hypothetical protein